MGQITFYYLCHMTLETSRSSVRERTSAQVMILHLNVDLTHAKFPQTSIAEVYALLTSLINVSLVMDCSG